MTDAECHGLRQRDGQFCRVRAPQNLVDIVGGAMEPFLVTGTDRHETAGQHIFSIGVDAWQLVLRREGRYRKTLRVDEAINGIQEPVRTKFRRVPERGSTSDGARTSSCSTAIPTVCASAYRIAN
jgi:hypothetical protein